MESIEANLLKRKYREADYSSSGGPNVKFSRLVDDIKQNFPDKDYSPKMLSAIVREGFPHSGSRQLTASRNKFVFGVEPKDEGCSGDEIVQLRLQVECLQAELSDRDHEAKRLQGKVAELDNKVEKLQVRVVELENQAQQRETEQVDTHEKQLSLAALEKQMSAVVGSNKPSVPWSQYNR